MMTIAAALGAGSLAFGVLLIVRGLIAPPVALDAAIAELHRPRTTATHIALTFDPLARLVSGSNSDGVSSDLAVTEMTSTQWALSRLTWAGLGGAPSVIVLLFITSGLWSVVPTAVAVLLLPPGLIAGWLYAVVALHGEANEARRTVRHTTAAYLEFVTILMAGGAGPESAMFDAAEIGHGPSFRHIRSAIATSRMRREDPWIGLGRVGRDLGVVELVELEATMRLAAGGAKVKSSLTAKAASIREKDLAHLESAAQARSESMILPVMLMFAGFIVLLGYPALAGLAAT